MAKVAYLKKRPKLWKNFKKGKYPRVEVYNKKLNQYLRSSLLPV